MVSEARDAFVYFFFLYKGFQLINLFLHLSTAQCTNLLFFLEKMGAEGGRPFQYYLVWGARASAPHCKGATGPNECISCKYQL